MCLRTMSGKEVELYWLSINAFNDYLVFEVKSNSIVDTFAIFSNPDDLQILTYVFDSIETQYEGFTQLRLINQTGTDRILVYLYPSK